MNREELITRLALLEVEGKITLEEARELLAQFDAGWLNPSDLPLTREEERQILLTGFLAITGGAYLNEVRKRLRAQRNKPGRFVVVEFYEENLEPLAGIFSRSDPEINRWHESMARVVMDNAHAMAEAGIGRRLFEHEHERITRGVRSQLGYLERFADEVAFRKLIGRPMSEKAIFDRSRQYGGFAIGQFYRFAESLFAGVVGYVARYIPKDDNGTCAPCHEAGQITFFLPGTGPMPGEICVAKGKCRCERKIEFNIVEYDKLKR